MKGKILLFDNNSNTGIIIGDIGNKYSFDINNVINSNNIFIGDLCEFTPKLEDSKYVAINITIDNKTYKFLKIGEEKILLNDIIDYGIEDIVERRLVEENLEEKVQEFFEKDSNVYSIRDCLKNNIFTKIKDKANHLFDEIDREVIVGNYLFVIVDYEGDERLLKFNGELEDLKRIEKRLDSYFGVIE